MIIKIFVFILNNVFAGPRKYSIQIDPKEILKNRIDMSHEKIRSLISQIKQDLPMLYDVLYYSIESEKNEWKKNKRIALSLNRSLKSDSDILKCQEICQTLVKKLNEAIKGNIYIAHNSLPTHLKSYELDIKKFISLTSDALDSLPPDKKQLLKNLLLDIKKSFIAMKKREGKKFLGISPKYIDIFKSIFGKPKKYLIVEDIFTNIFYSISRCQKDLKRVINVTSFENVKSDFFIELSNKKMNHQLFLIQKTFENEIDMFCICCQDNITQLHDILLKSTETFRLIRKFTNFDKMNSTLVNNKKQAI